MIIPLEPLDLSLARAMAEHRRHYSSGNRGTSWEQRLLGSQGEIAFSIMTGYPLLWNCRSVPDSHDFIGDPNGKLDFKIDVKSIEKPDHNLLVRSYNEEPPKVHVFVLMERVTYDEDEEIATFKCVGWVSRLAVCTPQSWKPGMKHPCWMYPRELLEEWENYR
jgi:hypothetical protein